MRVLDLDVDGELSDQTHSPYDDEDYEDLSDSEYDESSKDRPLPSLKYFTAMKSLRIGIKLLSAFGRGSAPEGEQTPTSLPSQRSSHQT